MLNFTACEKFRSRKLFQSVKLNRSNLKCIKIILNNLCLVPDWKLHIIELEIFLFELFYYLTIHPFSHQKCRKLAAPRPIFWPLPRRHPYLTRFVDFTRRKGRSEPHNRLSPQDRPTAKLHLNREPSHSYTTI